MKKAIVFDLYGTLIDIRTDENTKKLWALMTIYYGYHGAYYEDLKTAYGQRVKDYLSKETAEYPDIEILDVFNQLFVDKGVFVDKATLLQTATTFRLLSTEYLKLYPHALELLETLKANGLKVILLSNAQSSFTLNELKLLGLISKFDSIYISSDYKLSKPDQNFYQIMLDKEKLTADECVYVGNDHTTDIKGANAVGMDSIYLYSNCSPEPSVFECLHKIMPLDLKAVEGFCQQWYKK